jgi:hypothetical protein
VSDITRTYRAAIRIGEDFITLEETIALPLDATDEQIAQAVDLGWRVYRAQREAATAQIADMRTTMPMTIREPDAAASDKQRAYVATLQDQLRWSSEQMGVYATEQGIDLVTMTKGQASAFIDGLKALTEERQPAQRPPPKTAAEAQQRFFARYSQTIGGASWASVQKYLNSRAPMPNSVEGWIAAAEAVKAHPRTLPEGWDDQPGVVSKTAELPV